MRPAKLILTAPIAAAKATAENLGLPGLTPRFAQKFVHVFSRSAGGTLLKLNRLALPRESTYGDTARARVGGEQIADKKIASMKIFQVFIDDQTDKKI